MSIRKATNMVIAIDGNEANIENKVGVNVYAFELLCYINKLYQKQEKTKDPIRFEVLLKEEPRKDMPRESEYWKYKVLPGAGLWILTKLTPYLFRNKKKYAVVFSPSHYVPFFSRVPKVCSIMDLGYLDFSGQFTKKDFWQLKIWTAISILVSKRIIAISNSTRRDIVRHHPSAKDKVSVIYPGYDRKVFEKTVPQGVMERVKKHYSIVSDYVLFLSTLKPSKNIEGLIEAFKRVADESLGVKLVIAGKKGWLYESIFKQVSEMGLEKDVVFTGFVPEGDKPALIKGAKVFVLASFWEGFGLDPLYAMALGVPVVVSNKGSLPEVVGEAGLLVDPNNKADISEKIIKVLKMDKKDYNIVTKRGQKQAKKFSWERAAKETVEILVNSNNNTK